MESNNLIVEKEKILMEEPILSAEKEQALRKQIAELTDTNNALKEENSELKEQLEYLKRMMFGRKSEKSNVVMDGGVQLDFFDEADVNAEAAFAQIEKIITVPAHQRKKKRTHSEAFDKLEVQEIIHPAEDKICSVCGSEMQTIGKEFVRDE